MPSAPFRRTLALAALTVGLHVLGLLVIVPRIDCVGDVPSAPLEMHARLIAAPAAPLSTPDPAPPPPVLRPPPPVPKVALPDLVLADQAPANGASNVPETSASAAAPVLAPLPIEASATVRLADVESVAVVPTPAPPAPAPATPAPAPATPTLQGKAYRSDVPPPARIVLDVARKDADGTRWHGESAMAWQVAGGQYHVKLEAGIRVLVTRVNLVVLESSGKIGAAGFVPRTMTEKRRGRAATATEFGPASGKISFSATPNSYAIDPGTQDKATIPLQLAAIARADSEQLKGNVDILVGEDRDASVFRFVLVGQEEIDTPAGRLATWHLSRPPRVGAYNSRLDIWLAPSLGWLPVRIDNIESSGAMTTQTVKLIGKPES